ncbi:MAG: nicotinate phosphoribosyltransferase [Candidatus Falkowbacteria bacterium]
MYLPSSLFSYKQDKGIIQTLMDVDFYKFTMGQLAFKYYRNVQVTFKFTNRNKNVKLAKIIDIARLREELDHCRTLSFKNSEIHYLRGTNEYQHRMFEEDYLQFLATLRLPDYELEFVGDEIWLTFTGFWPEVTLWETLALSIINELYVRAMLGKDTSAWERNYAVGVTRLYEKIESLREYPELVFTDFCTRRRFNGPWQGYCIETTVRELPGQFLGTSNVMFSQQLADHNFVPMGTSAHERDMVLAALQFNSDVGILNSLWQSADEWYNQYGEGLSIFLPDTFGTDAFFAQFGSARAKKWKGSRQDSADPYAYGRKLIKYYEGYEIDPRNKMCIFSDGLTHELMICLHIYFHRQLKDGYGYGTHFGNDLLVPPLPIVVKVDSVNGNPAVKLSDNLAKGMGLQTEQERYKRIFGYTRDFRQECVV